MVNINNYQLNVCFHTLHRFHSLHHFVYTVSPSVCRLFSMGRTCQICMNCYHFVQSEDVQLEPVHYLNY